LPPSLELAPPSNYRLPKGQFEKKTASLK
jgi:hypothetical protein